MRRNPDQKAWVLGVALGEIAVLGLDSPLGEAAVEAHIRLTGGAGNARFRVRSAYHGDHEVAGTQAASPARHPAERLVADRQHVALRWRLTVLALEEIAVRAAAADLEHVDEDLARSGLRLREIGEPSAIGNARRDDECFHE
jgi:hypothetical protein